MCSSALNAVRSFLKCNNMFVEDEWLTGCVEYLTENSDTNLSIIELQNLAKEQWLLNDLKDICPGSLPPNLAREKKTVLKDRYVLQINSAIDIGTPAYQQYLKIQKVNMDNVEATIRNEEKVPNHRMIKLCLTDGEQDITGIEYRPMRNLTGNITPGTKVLIKGPVDCRRGVLLLTESSVELLGGDVADIVSTNSLPALLASKLGLPIPQETDSNILSQPGNTDIPAPHSGIDMKSTIQGFEQKTEQNSTGYKIEDDIDIDQINALEALLNPLQQEPNSSERPEKKPKIEVVDMAPGVYVELDPVKRPSTSKYEIPEKKIKVDTTPAVDDYIDEIDEMYDDHEELLKQIDTEMNVYDMEESIVYGPRAVSSDPFVYITQINRLSDQEKRGRVFKVKAQIVKISKLAVNKDSCSLKCTIVDGTGSLDVEFASAVFSQLVGYTHQDMVSFKKEMATNSQLKETIKSKVTKALNKARETLTVLYCIIEITMQEVATITNLVTYDNTHVNLLKKRIEKAGL